MDDSTLILGVDCGGTKTVALLADSDGKIIGRGTAGSANSNLVGREGALQAIDQAVSEAFRAAQLPQKKAAVLCVGMAGVDRPEEKEWFTRRLLATGLAERVDLSNDARLLLAAGTPDGWGIGAISGTGSITFGVGPTGQFTRAGGWGYVFGDEGSGYDIGRQALRAVARASDGRGPATALTNLILQHWSLPQPDSLIPHVYQTPLKPFDIGQLVSLVMQAAAAGDLVANDILAAAAKELALSMVAVIRSLDLQGEIPCALGGGIFVHLETVREQVVRQVQSCGCVLRPVTVVTEPVLGAVRIAAGLLNG